MKIILNTVMAGPKGSFGPGLCDVPDHLAKDALNAGFAKLPIFSKIENASIIPQETRSEIKEEIKQEVLDELTKPSKEVAAKNKEKNKK